MAQLRVQPARKLRQDFDKDKLNATGASWRKEVDWKKYSEGISNKCKKCEGPLNCRNCEPSIKIVKEVVYLSPFGENAGWAANKNFEVLNFNLKFNFKFPRARTFELFRPRSRLYRSQILQVNTRWKALAEIYTMHSFAQLCNLIFLSNVCQIIC